MKDFRFTDKTTNPDDMARLLIQPRLWVPGGDYPGHTDWVDKSIAQLQGGTKRIMLAYWGREAIGEIIYQRHPVTPSIAEIRNISVEPAARGRHVAGFLLRQVECEVAHEFPGVTEIHADTKRTNHDMLSFAVANGYKLKMTTMLDSAFGHNGVEDVIFSKILVPKVDQPR